MCIMPSTPTPTAPVLPAETQATKAPDAGAVRSATGRRTADQMKSGANTILTSANGVLNAAPTERKTLLGQ